MSLAVGTRCFSPSPTMRRRSPRTPPEQLVDASTTNNMLSKRKTDPDGYAQPRSLDCDVWSAFHDAAHGQQNLTRFGCRIQAHPLAEGDRSTDSNHRPSE